MKKRLLGVLLCLCMVFGLLPTTALAEELDQPHDSGVTVGESGICDHHQEHTEECGYNDAEGIACCYSCELCAEQESEPQGDSDILACTCDAAEGEPHTEDCALYEAPTDLTCACGTEDGVHTEECPLNTDPSQPAPETDEKVEAVRALIAALPDVEELEGMTTDEQRALYEGDLMAADEAYQTLNDEQKTQLTAENQKLDELFGFFSAPVMVMPTAATEYGIVVGGVQVTSENAGNITGASISSGTVSYDPDTNTLELNNAIIRYEGIGISSDGALNITLTGTDNLIESSEHGIWVQGNLQISGDGADTSKLTVKSGTTKDGIFAYSPYGGYNEALTIDAVTLDVTAGGTTGISTSKSVTITDSDITTTGKNYGLQGGNFGYVYDDANPSIINISNSTITAKATGSDAEAKAFEAAPVNSVINKWRSGSSDEWTDSSTPDFTQTYLELEFGSAASTEHASHPICGASCSHSSGTHSDVTWTGVSDLTSITSAGNYYLTDNVTLTDSWKPANGVVLCLNGHTITQTNDYDTPVIEVEHPNTFTLTDCSDTPGKITHKEGRSGAGVESSNEFIMYGGEISGNPNGGVNIAGRFTLEGGAIRNNTVFGVTITSNEDDNVPGLFTMKSGSIERNISYMGGGVWVYATTKPEDVIFTMEGGTIRHNTAVMGGGVYVHGATFNMNGGSICENNVTTSENIGEDVNGGGVYVSDYVGESLSSRPVFNLSGGEISGNVKDGTISGSTLSGGTDNNVYLTAARTINISSTLTGTGKIGVTTQTPPAEDYSVPITGTNSGDFSSYFTSDNTAYEPFNDNNVVKLRMKAATTVVNAETPTIMQEPADATYTKGDAAAALSVSASVTDGGTLSYQWYKGDGFTSSKIAGATSSTYTPPTDTMGAVEYTCVVTNTIQDNGDGGTKTATKQCSVRITVTEDADSEYSISLDTTGTYTFPSATEGYSALTPLTVTVTNTGTATTGNLHVYLTGNSDMFVLSVNTITNIEPNDTATFTVAPKTGLAADEYPYTASVSVMNADHGIDAAFTVKFTVNAAGGSAPDPHFHSGGTATCKDAAVCSGCGQQYGSKNSNNHTGGTEVRGKVDATTIAEGYTGDTYCKGCGTLLSTGTSIPKKDSGETGGNTDGGDSGTDDNGDDSATAPDDGVDPPADPPSIPVTVPVSGDENTVQVGASVSGTKATIDDIDLSTLNNVIGEDVKTGVVTIDFSVLNVEVDTVEIPSDMVKLIAEAVNDPNNDAESLEIVLTDGTSIEYDAKALGEKFTQVGGLDITISILPSAKATPNHKQKETIGGRPFYDISVTSGGEHISNLGGHITVHAPYELKPGEHANGITVWYVDDNGNRERCETNYDSAKKRVTWKTDHLSVYMIGYEKPQVNPDTGGEEIPKSPDTGDDTPVAPSYVTYTVQKGDTLWAIAKKYGCTVSEIVTANSALIKNPDLIYAGWQLKIPQGEATGVDTKTPDAILPEDKKTGVYIVRHGDTLWAISKKYGCTVAEIVALNGELITDPNLIFAGWELKIPQD